MRIITRDYIRGRR